MQIVPSVGIYNILWWLWYLWILLAKHRFSGLTASLSFENCFSKTKNKIFKFPLTLKSQDSTKLGFDFSFKNSNAGLRSGSGSFGQIQIVPFPPDPDPTLTLEDTNKCLTDDCLIPIPYIMTCDRLTPTVDPNGWNINGVLCASDCNTAKTCR